ncbi:hypothetical protein, partial [Anaerobaca lacustris]|nr:hypothetical protein [Sedimentisphaerales bacterium M17dextr]
MTVTASEEGQSPAIADLKTQHGAIVDYLRQDFRRFIEGQSQDLDIHGNRTPFFKERDKQSLMHL